MSDIHVTAGGDGNQGSRIVIHIPIPHAPNSAAALRVRPAAENTGPVVQVQRILKHYGQTLAGS